MAESEEKLKSLLMKVEEESEKASLKLNIQKTEILASGPISLWQIHRGKVEMVTDFIFLDSKIIVNNHCSQEINRLLPLGRKTMTNLDSILKNRDITLLTNVHIVKAVVFSVVMDRCERLYCLLISKLHTSQRRCFILKFPVSRYMRGKQRLALTHMRLLLSLNIY